MDPRASGAACASRSTPRGATIMRWRCKSSNRSYGAPGRPIVLKDLYLQRKWLGYYGGAIHARKDFSHETAAMRLAPEYTDADLATIWKGNEFSQEHLLADVVAADFSVHKRFDCPIILFNGRHDYNVWSSVAAEWFETVKAPSKKLVWFEHSAHEMFNEEPGKVLDALLRHVRPVAEKAGDVAP